MYGNESSTDASGCRISRGRRAPEPEAGELLGHVGNRHRAVIRRVRPDPRQVVAAERRPGDDAKAILGEPRHGEVALDPAALVQHLGVRDRTDVAGDAVVRRAVRGRRLSPGPRPRSWRTRSRRTAPPALAARAVLGADRRRPEPPGPAAGPQRLVALRRRSARTSSPAPSPTSRRRPRPARWSRSYVGETCSGRPAWRSWPGYLTS